MIMYIKLKQEEEMFKQGLSDSDIEKYSGMMEFTSRPDTLSGLAFLGTLVVGLVISLICAGILKKEDPSAQIS